MLARLLTISALLFACRVEDPPDVVDTDTDTDTDVGTDTDDTPVPACDPTLPREEGQPFQYVPASGSPFLICVMGDDPCPTGGCPPMDVMLERFDFFSCVDSEESYPPRASHCRNPVHGTDYDSISLDPCFRSEVYTGLAYTTDGQLVSRGEVYYIPDAAYLTTMCCGDTETRRYLVWGLPQVPCEEPTSYLPSDLLPDYAEVCE